MASSRNPRVRSLTSHSVFINICFCGGAAVISIINTSGSRCSVQQQQSGAPRAREDGLPLSPTPTVIKTRLDRLAADAAAARSAFSVLLRQTVAPPPSYTQRSSSPGPAHKRRQQLFHHFAAYQLTMFSIALHPSAAPVPLHPSLSLT